MLTTLSHLNRTGPCLQQFEQQVDQQHYAHHQQQYFYISPKSFHQLKPPGKGERSITLFSVFIVR
jgi:hypothetical protein